MTTLIEMDIINRVFFVVFGLIFIIGTISYGIFFLVGTWQKWTILNKHIEYWWGGFPLSAIEKSFGHKGLLIFNYSFGALCIFVGLIGLVNGVKEFLSP
ncbi:MAG: hypothetical protein WBO24_08150 [Nitrospirales bacterium]